MGKILEMRQYVRDTMQNLVSMLGTPRDKSYFNEFVFEVMDRSQLEAAYRSDWVSRKIIDVPAKDSTREGRSWKADDKDVEKIEEYERKIGLMTKLKFGQVRGRLYGGGALVMGFGDNAAVPLDPSKVKKDGLKYLHVLSAHDLKSGPIVNDVNDEDFGLPEHYDLNINVAGSVVNATRIHRSRIVRLVGAPLPDPQIEQAQDRGWGDSVLQTVRDAVMNVATSTGAVAYLMQEMKLDIVKIPDFMKNMADPQYRADVTERFALSNQTKSLTSTLLLDREEEWDRVEANFAGLPDVMKLYLLIASGAADIPATRLLGQSAVGLNATGEGDLKNYYDAVASEQKTVLSPALAKLDEVIIRSALGDKPEGIWADWNPLWQMSDNEKADLAKKRAETAKIYVDANLIPPEVLSKAVISELIDEGDYSGLEQAYEEWEAAGGDVNEKDPNVQEQFAESKKLQKEQQVPPEEEEEEEAPPPRLRVVGADKEFDESEVERDENGKFSSGGGGGGSKKESAAVHAIQGMSAEEIKGMVVKGGSAERVTMRAALKTVPKGSSYDEERSALQGKILESFHKDYEKAVAKGNSAKASELAAKTASYAKQYGKPDPISSKMTSAQANLGYSPKEVSVAKEVAASVGVSGTQYSPQEAKAFNDLAALTSPAAAKAYAQEAKAGAAKYGITAGEGAHISAYTGSQYASTNSALRTGVMTEQQWNHVAQLNQALDKLPDYRGTVYRKAELTPQQFQMYKSGMVVEERAFTSSSTSSGVWSGSYRYEIRSKTGKDVKAFSLHKSENEVLFRNGTRFRVTGVTGNTIKMEEVGYATLKSAD